MLPVLQEAQGHHFLLEDQANPGYRIKNTWQVKRQSGQLSGKSLCVYQPT